MKAELLNDEGADYTSATTEQRSRMKDVSPTDKPRSKFIYPAKTVFEGAHAVFLVKSGQAAPLDDDCKQACGMSDEQQAEKQQDYFMDLLGINSLEDRDFFRGGIILGYKPDRSYIPGPNWDAFQAKKAKEEAEDEV